MTPKPTICLDFDGCIHRYRHGWREGEIYDEAVEGFFEWAYMAQQSFRLLIYSSRSQSEGGLRDMRDWLLVHRTKWLDKNPEFRGIPLEIDFALAKPAAYLTIDDRCICFTGRWDADDLHPSKLINFKSWASSP